MMYLIDYVRKHAVATPDRIAIVSHGRETTYGQLLSQVEERAVVLRREGIRAGETCPLPAATQDDAYVVSYLAMDLIGALPILLTTGTTGKPKEILITREAWMANADNLVHGHAYDANLVFVATGPLTHLGNLSKLYPTFLVGATLYIMEGMKSLDDFFAALDYVPSVVTAGDGSMPKKAAFLVPASIRMLMQLAGDRLRACADRIDFIETGAAPISQADMRGLSEMLPHSRLYNTYASTETGIICTYQFNDGLHLSSCVGPAMRHAHVYIADEDGEPFDSDAQHPGYVACEGPTVMGGRFRTNDLGYLSPEGYLFLTGRASDIINVGGLKVSPVEIEDAALSLAEIKDCICLAEPHPLLGQAPKLLVVMTKGVAFDKRLIARHLKERLETYKVPLLYEEVDHIERTYNGKLNRKFYTNH